MSDEFKVYVIEPDGDAPASGSPDPSGQFTGHSLSMPRLWRRNKEIPADALQSSWANTNVVIMNMIEDAQKKESDTGMKLTEIEVTLAVSGEGTVGFVSGKAEAGIVLKFARG